MPRADTVPGVANRPHGPGICDDDVPGAKPGLEHIVFAWTQFVRDEPLKL